MRLVLLAVTVFASCETEVPATVVIAPLPPSSPAETASGTLLAVPVPRGPDDACRVDGDCTWGEIPHDIRAPSDCMCLFGCAYLAQNKMTQLRRAGQHLRLCTPGMDGHGNGCPIDDCAAPPPIRCVSGRCTGKR
jgi:hypothetical protein